MDNKIRVKIIPIYGNIEKLLDIDFDIFKSSVLDRSLIRMDVIGGDSQMEKIFMQVYKLMSEEQKQAIEIIIEQRLNQLSNLRKSHYLNDKYEEIHTSSPDDIQNICKTCNYKSGCDYYHRLRDNKNGENDVLQ